MSRVNRTKKKALCVFSFLCGFQEGHAEGEYTCASTIRKETTRVSRNQQETPRVVGLYILGGRFVHKAKRQVTT